MRKESSEELLNRGERSMMNVPHQLSPLSGKDAEQGKDVNQFDQNVNCNYGVRGVSGVVALGVLLITDH